MESEIGAELSSSILIHPGLSGGFREMNSLARKRDSSKQGSGFLYKHHPQRMNNSSHQKSNNWNPNSWNWDSARFIANPVLNSSPMKETEQNSGFENHEHLMLNLRGLPLPIENHTEGSNKRVCSISPGSYPVCQVDDCKSDLSCAKDYHRRHKVCEVHSKTSKAVVANQMQRFCQQCSR